MIKHRELPIVIAFLAIIFAYYTWVMINQRGYNDGWVFKGLISVYIISLAFLITLSIVGSRPFSSLLIALTFISMNILTPVIKYGYSPYNPNDSMAHLSFAKWIFVNGRIPTIDTPLYYAKPDKYSFTPAMHILSAIVAAVSGVPIGYFITILLVVQNFTFYLSVILILKNYLLVEKLSPITYLITESLLVILYWFSSTSVFCPFIGLLMYVIQYKVLNKASRLPELLALTLLLYIALIFSHPAYHLLTMYYLTILFIVTKLHETSTNHRNLRSGSHELLPVIYVFASLIFGTYVCGEIFKALTLPLIETFEGKAPIIYQVEKAKELGLDIFTSMRILVFYYTKLTITYILSGLIAGVLALRSLRTKFKAGYIYSEQPKHETNHLVFIIISFLFSYIVFYVHRAIESLFRLAPFLSIAYLPQIAKMIEDKISTAKVVGTSRMRKIVATLFLVVIALNIVNYPSQPLLPYFKEDRAKYKPGGTVMLVSNKLTHMTSFAKTYCVEVKVAFDPSFFPFGVMDMLHEKYFWIEINTLRSNQFYVLACFSEKDMPFGEGTQSLLTEKIVQLSEFSNIVYDVGSVVIFSAAR